MLGNNAKGESMFQEILPIERKLYPNDVMLARTLEGLASLRLADQHYDEALSFAEEGLNITLKAGPEDSIDEGLAYGTVAEIHRAAGRPERALPLFRKARAIFEKQLGPMNARSASIMGQEGLILLHDGKLGLAEKNLVKSFEVLNRVCPDCTMERIVAQTNLGVLRLRQKKYAEADTLFSDALTLQEKYYAQPGADEAATLRALAMVRQKQRRFADAEQLQRRANLLTGYR
jgi:tetratricopeptide (TPR) repeat protein